MKGSSCRRVSELVNFRAGSQGSFLLRPVLDEAYVITHGPTSEHSFGAKIALTLWTSE